MFSIVCIGPETSKQDACETFSDIESNICEIEEPYRKSNVIITHFLQNM